MQRHPLFIRRITWPDCKRFIKRAVPLWRGLDPELMAAGLSYFALFSFAPLLFLTLTFAGRVVSRPEAKQVIMDRVSLWLADDTADSLQAWMDRPASQRHHKGTTFFGLLIASVAGAQVLGYMKRILNRIWDVRPKKRAAWKTWILSWLFNFMMLMVLGAFLTLSIVLDTSVGIFWKFFRGWLPAHLILSASWLQGMNFAVSLFFFCLLFALIYRFVPDTKMEWGDVWAGALMTSILLAIGKVGLSLYLSIATFASVFGAASSVIVLLFSIYVGANIFVFGGAFTRVYAELYGSRRVEVPTPS